MLDLLDHLAMPGCSKIDHHLNPCGAYDVDRLRPMTKTSLLCEFLTNPFGDEQKACELLSEIENRPLSDAELERGLFCFQIAFYFLARLAITAHIEDSSLQRDSIDQLHDRIRAFYAYTGLKVKFSEFVVSPAERDQFIAILRRQLDEQARTRADTFQLTTTKLALFDFVGVRRICEYHDAMGQANRLHKFYVVAEQVLFHYGAKKYHAVPVEVIAALLLANYNIVSNIVISGSPAVDAPQTEDEDVFQPMPLSPSMPDVTRKQPNKIYLASIYVLFLLEDVGPIGGGDFIRYRYVLAVCDKRRNLPVCFITLEDSPSVSNVLCVFERNGSHSNYGSLRGHNLLREFISKGMGLIRYRFDLGEIEELAPRQQRQSRWKFWCQFRRISGGGTPRPEGL